MNDEALEDYMYKKMAGDNVTEKYPKKPKKSKQIANEYLKKKFGCSLATVIESLKETHPELLVWKYYKGHL